ncbi:MAG: hypothetical protein K6G72_13095 [Lachnospiraceae bacterium]|nr:hypothetical protein [Lachnospiraceae bacterium]
MTKKLVRTVSAVLVVALGIGLAGCGKKEEETKTSVALDGAGEGYEFVSESKDLSEFIDLKGNIDRVKVKDGKAYAFEKFEGKTILHVADLGTSEDKAVEVDFSNVFPKTEGSTEVAPADDTNEAAKENEASVEEEQSETVITEEVIEEEVLDEGGFVDDGIEGRGDYIGYDGDDGCYVTEMSIASDGNIFAILYNWSGETSSRVMCKISPDGKVEKLYSLNDVVSENEGIGSIYVKEDGGLYISVESKLVSIDNTGKQVGSADSGSWINNVFVDEKGDCYATYYGQNGQVCKKADFSSGAFTEDLDMPSFDGKLVKKSDTSYIMAGYDSVYEYNTETKEKTKLWDWINIDVTDVNTESFEVNSDDTYSIISYQYRGEKPRYEYLKISKQPISGENARKDIIYGCTYLDWDLRQKITDFNKSQSEYRIRVKTYIDMNGDWNQEEYNNQLARYKADIAGGGIDLMSVDSTDYSAIQLAKKGAFLDLSEYYSSVANRGDYFENILDIFKIDNKDYFAINKVGLISMIGNAEIFKGKTSWTSQDLLELRKQYPDKEFIEYASKESAISTMVVFSLNTFIDYEKGTVDFCNQRFYDLLNFANTFPKEVNYEDYDVYGKLASGDIIVAELMATNCRDVSMYRQIMGEDAVIIGPPNDEGIRAQVIPTSMFAISSKTEAKEGCYQFLKSLEKGDENEYTNGSGLPVLKKAFYDTMKKEITPQTYVDENGETQVIESSYSIGTESGTIDIRNANQGDVDVIEDLMVNAKDTIRIDEKFSEIFMEEIQPFFEGKKTAEETANVLQSRMKIYLSEQE